MSVLLGIAFGVGFTFLSKHLRFLHKHEKLASVYILYTAYISYSVAKMMHFAAAVTIFVVGLLYSHYLSYNITKES